MWNIELENKNNSEKKLFKTDREVSKFSGIPESKINIVLWMKPKNTKDDFIIR